MKEKTPIYRKIIKDIQDKDELYAMHLTEEEILRLASEILLGQMDN